MVNLGEAVPAEVLHDERRRLLFLSDGRGVRSEEDAAAYVEQRGFVHLFSPGRLPWPNLSDAELRARGSLETFSLDVWHWKNTLPVAKRCAYGHHLRNRGVFISWRLFPAFRRLWGLCDPVDRVLESGVLPAAERHVLQVVAVQGPIRSRNLRREAEELSGATKREYQAALRMLQERFLITVAGGSVAGFSMHDWDLVERHVPPEAMELGISRDEAQRQLTLQAVANAPFCTAREIGLLFGWSKKQVATVLGELTESGAISAGLVEGQKDLGYRLAG